MKRIILLCSFLFSTLVFGQNYWFQTDSINGAPRSVASSFVVNGDGYVVGGLDENGFRRQMYSYSDIQDDWDDELAIGGDNGNGLARGSACAFNIGNKGYVCLGQGDSQAFKKDLWQYDPTTDVWTQMGGRSVVGTGTSDDLTVYGKVFQNQQAAAAGSYNDTVTVTVLF